MRLLIVSMLAAFLAMPVAAANPSLKRVIITFKAKATKAQRDAVLSAVGGRQVANILSDGNTADEFVAVVAEVPASIMPSVRKTGLPDMSGTQPKSLMELVPAISKSDIIQVEEDYKVKWIESTMAAGLPSMTAVMGSLPKLALTGAKGSGLMALATRPEITWGIERVKAPAAWDSTQGAGVRVAVIDTGIDSSHKDLQGKVDGGYDAFTQSEAKEAWQDQNGHGTHVAGTIGALKDDKGVVGVAPKARLYAVRVLDADGSGSLSGVIDGIIWAANNGMQVANMSLGSSQPSETMQRALRYAKSRGVVVVAAAGNSGGSVGFPGAYPEVIGVAASDSNDKVASFSSRGPEVDFIAPGVYVVSSAMGGGYANFSGTSMACPHVAGLAALAVSQGYVGLDGPDGVMAQLKKAAKKLVGPSDEEQGFGMIDAGKLVR